MWQASQTTAISGFRFLWSYTFDDLDTAYMYTKDMLPVWGLPCGNFICMKLEFPDSDFALSLNPESAF